MQPEKCFFSIVHNAVLFILLLLSARTDPKCFVLPTLAYFEFIVPVTSRVHCTACCCVFIGCNHRVRSADFFKSVFNSCRVHVAISMQHLHSRPIKTYTPFFHYTSAFWSIVDASRATSRLLSPWRRRWSTKTPTTAPPCGDNLERIEPRCDHRAIGPAGRNTK